MRKLSPFAARAARLPLALALGFTFAGTAFAAPAPDMVMHERPGEDQASSPRSIEIVPPEADEKAAKKPVPYSKMIVIKGPNGTQTYMYKCGDEYTDSPVCAPRDKAATTQPTTEEMSRCKAFGGKDFVPWYCR